MVCPSTKNILKSPDPIMLPIAISLSPLRAAVIDVTSSGSDVPTATIVSPTKVWLIPKFTAISVAAFTTISPPNTTPIKPRTEYKILFEKSLR